MYYFNMSKITQSLRSSLNRTISKHIKPFQSQLSNVATHVALQVYPEQTKSRSTPETATNDQVGMKACTEDKDCQWVTEQPLNDYNKNIDYVLSTFCKRLYCLFGRFTT